MRLSIAFPFARLNRLLGCLLLLLGGCTPEQLLKLGQPSIDGHRIPAQLPANTGIVVFSLTGNTEWVRRADYVEFREVKVPKPGPSGFLGHHLVRSPQVPAARDTRLFIATLPAGDYVFWQVGQSTEPRTFYHIGEPAREQLGRFRVLPGATADLGRLIMTQSNTLARFGRSTRVTSNETLVRRYFPAGTSVFDRALAGGWLEPRHADDDVEEMALMRPTGFAAFAELDDGRVVAAGRLGTVLEKVPEGRWRIRQGDTLDSLLWVMADPSDARVLIAAGDFNAMWRFDEHGQASPLSPGNMPPGSIKFIGGSDKSGWYVMLRHGSSVSVLQARQLEGGDWQALHKEELDPIELIINPAHTGITIWSTSNGFAYGTASGKIVLIDYITGQRVERKVPAGGAIRRVAAGPNGSLGVLSSAGASGTVARRRMFVSLDSGQKWIQFDSPYDTQWAAPVVLASGTWVLQGGEFGGAQLRASNDSGKTWQLLSDTMSREESLVALPTQGLLAVSDGEFSGIVSIRSSRDEGRTWRTEYSTFSAQARERENQETERHRPPRR